MSADGTSHPDLGRAPVGLAVAVVGFSVLYFVSDVVEVVQGGFSPAQLWLTYVAEAAIPFLVLGLCVVQWPRIGRVGVVGALGYAYTFVFFTGTVLFALVNDVGSWSALADELGAWVAVHGALMVIFGLALGWAVRRAGVLPRWTGAMLMAGVVLVAVSSTMPEIVQLAAAGFRDLAFAGMGIALLTGRAPTSSNTPEELEEAGIGGGGLNRGLQGMSARG